MPSTYFFFRPILAADRSWAAADWQPGTFSPAPDADFAACYSDSDAASLAGLLPLVRPAQASGREEQLQTNEFAARHVVFIAPSSVLQDANAVERYKALRARGCPVGIELDDVSILRRIPIDAFSHVRFDAAFVRQEFSTADLSYFRDAGFFKIAANVDSYEMFGWLAGRGVEWSASHFLTGHNPNLGKEPDLTRLKLLKLLNLVRNDGDTREIEAVFREEPKLSYHLLRLVNSVAVGARTKISSFSQAIAILGRRQLQRWLQLLVYANNLADGHAPNPLMQLAAARGRQMELICGAIDPKPGVPDLADNAFITGLFSLLDVLINLPMSEIVKELPVHEAVIEALSSPNTGGALGRLVSAVAAGEAGQFAMAERALAELGITPELHSRAQVAALHWASRINIENSD